MKGIFTICVLLLAVPALAQNRRTIEVPPPRYAPAQGATQQPAGQPQLYGNSQPAAPAQVAPAQAAPTPNLFERNALDRRELERAARQAEASGELAHVGAVRQKLRPPELLAEALSTPQDAFRDGQRWPLVDALARSRDRQQQLRITQVYWKLAGAQADYHFARDLSQRLWRVTERHAEQPAVQSARHSAEAAVDDAETAVVAAQHELAEQMNLRPDEPLPLAIDRPHVGEYRTYFDSLFAGRTPPPRLWLTHRSLPIRRKAIDLHGEAILSAQDALDATIEEFERRAVDLTTLLAAFEEFDRERRAFVAAVRDYNQDIAEYAMAVAAPGANGDRLVAMLIKTPTTHRQASPGRRSLDPREFRPAVEAPPQADRTFQEEPPAADYRSAPPADYRSAPPADYRAAPPADYRSAPPADYRSSAVEPEDGGVRSASAEAPADVLPAALGPPQTPAADPAVEPPPSTDPFGPRRYEAQKPQASSHVPQAAPYSGLPGASVDQGEYSGLWHLAPALRAQKLAGILHWWERTLPPDSGAPTSLPKVLERTAPASRRAVIDAYWRAREAAARYQIYAEAGDHLTPLTAGALRLREEPGGAAAMLRVQAARLGLQANLLDAQLNLLAAQWTLTQLAGGRLDQPWLLPTTVPHAGRYRLPAHREALGDARRWADNLPPIEAAVQERAAAVVFADAARAEAAHPGAGTVAGLNLAVERVRRQMRETQAFLQTQTQYNLAIADFALRSLPPGAPVDQLVARLVVPRSYQEG